MPKPRDLSTIKGVYPDNLLVPGIVRMPEPSPAYKKWIVLYRLIKKPQAVDNITRYHAAVAAHTIDALRKRRAQVKAKL